jgi:zinc/manganese transport system ATP-binding protein
MTGIRIEFRNVVVARGGTPILHIEQLAVEAGEFLGIIGRNGAGKTTLLHAAAGLIQPAFGTVFHGDRAITAMNGWGRTNARRRVACVPQAGEYNADLPLTVHEVVAMGSIGPKGLLRAIGASSKQRAQTWLERLDLGDLSRRTFRSLSGGEQQKVLLARAMVQEPALLLMDEPAANLDPDWKERLVRLLEKLYQANPLTVLMVSHETGLLPACCGRVALMDSGRIVRWGRPDEVLTPDTLARLYGCRVRVVEAAGRRYTMAWETAGP